MDFDLPYSDPVDGRMYVLNVEWASNGLMDGGTDIAVRWGAYALRAPDRPRADDPAWTAYAIAETRLHPSFLEHSGFDVPAPANNALQAAWHRAEPAASAVLAGVAASVSAAARSTR